MSKEYERLERECNFKLQAAKSVIDDLNNIIKELEDDNTWLRKFIWEDSINLVYDLENTTPPYRVGKKQKRAILDSKGHEIGVFITGQEKMAQVFCEFLNTNHNIWKTQKTK